MDFSGLLAAFASAFDQDNRLFQLHFADGGLDGQLLPHTLSGDEAVSATYRFELTCLCSDTTLELKKLMGQPVDIAIGVSDGGERIVSGVVTQAKQLGADGGFATYGLVVEPAFSVFKMRRNSRVFQDKTVVDIVKLILDEHIANNPAFAQTFRHREQLTASYPSRSYCQQYRESDLAFIERLLREEGISYVFDFTHGADEIGVHTLVLFDAGTELSAASQNTIRFHRADATEDSDSLTDWTAQRQIQSSAVQLASFDYKGVFTQNGGDTSAINHGDAEAGLTSNLEDYGPQSPYYGSDNSDVGRYATLRQQAHDLNAKTFTGSGVVRGIGAGQWFTLNDHPAHEDDSDSDRQFVITRQQFAARNNLPGDLEPLVTQGVSPDSPANDLLGATGAGFKNQISAVRRSIPIVPIYSHTEHAKPTALGMQTATVVGPAGEEIFTDELGRIKIQFHWAREQDHNFGLHGAGATKDDFSSCWVRVVYPSAGANWGHQFIPRIGQEVMVEFIEGDIDRPIVLGAAYNGQHTSPAFSGAGSLPANKTLSGIKSQEYKGNRYNEIIFDDSTGEIRTKLSSEHGKTQLNQGFLIHPRTEGKGTPRGEGFELRTDNAGALRAAQGLLISTEPQPNAGGKQLDRNSAKAQLDAAANLADQLGDTAKAQKANQPETGKNNQTINADSQAAANKASGHLHHLKEATNNLERNTNTDKDGKSGQGDQAGQQALLILSGQSGIAITTPQSATIVSGSNLDQVAQRDNHQATGKRWTHNVGENISIFVAGAQNKVKETLKLLAAKGNVQMQAQSGEIEITADKNIQLHAAKQKQTWSAQQEILITCGGAYIRIKGGAIEMHCPGKLEFKANQHNLPGGASLSIAPPNMPQSDLAPTDLEFRHVNWVGEAIAGARYRATLSDGSVKTGTTDAEGHFRIAGVPPGTTANVDYFGSTVTPKSTKQTAVDDDVLAFLNHSVTLPAGKDVV